MDETDAENLRLLVEDARRPYNDLAESVDLSAPAVRDRIDRLREVGVIRRFTVDVHRSQLRAGVPVLVDIAVVPSDLERIRSPLVEADTVKANSAEAVRTLEARGVDVWLLTGDNERTARAVAGQAGIDPDNVRAGVRPGDKASAIESIQDDGRSMMMVGDGVNDAPALAAAFVGTALGSGTDVAIEAADFTLLRDHPLDVVKAIRVSEGRSRKSGRTSVGRSATTRP